MNEHRVISWKYSSTNVYTHAQTHTLSHKCMIDAHCTHTDTDTDTHTSIHTIANSKYLMIFIDFSSKWMHCPSHKKSFDWLMNSSWVFVVVFHKMHVKKNANNATGFDSFGRLSSSEIGCQSPYSSTFSKSFVDTNIISNKTTNFIQFYMKIECITSKMIQLSLIATLYSTKYPFWPLNNSMGFLLFGCIKNVILSRKKMWTIHYSTQFLNNLLFIPSYFHLRAGKNQNTLTAG